ncbi:LysR family transcriptional regulator [Sporosarcina sp. P21c]|uniref:LysR family transcriptional regulator n=1 Tax=unclassified Sporosarcina TaxID=2647733 RepID=UPI000C17311A|nr:MULTISPECIES: LysR family transcriptional regulator [unclassified Sporosarcina]PIC67035.1 LysR family transcriptional regulator [Sporosarcina sp. P16a]PIC89760.1 LysR family transcriptional regulator [Sporosarcina sp. P21c]PIC92489.1 LysR family transcriptional regulator [Sporosarcina sp. P25]
MEFKDLEIFQMVAEKGTITAAAKELRYVQSNITSRIQKLEAELKTPLFNRHNRGMILTPEGKRLLIYSEKILSLTNEMRKVVQNDKEPSGKLELGSVETVIKLPIILSRYNNKYKQVDISLLTGVTEGLQFKVLNHQLDGAFISEGTAHPDLAVHDVLEEELVLLSSKPFQSIEDIKDEPILCFRKGCGYRARLELWLEDERFKPTKMMEFGTLETILGSVAAGLGVTFVPRSTVTHLLDRGSVYCYHLPPKYSQIKTVFVRRADSYLTPTIAKFIKVIDEFREKSDEQFQKSTQI